MRIVPIAGGLGQKGEDWANRGKEGLATGSKIDLKGRRDWAMGGGIGQGGWGNVWANS